MICARCGKDDDVQPTCRLYFCAACRDDAPYPVAKPITITERPQRVVEDDA